ncbi:MAG: 1-acyl-sn-glycerol-3-phosphate acyltransferase [Chloroflexi bacterium]|nr:1-acyl-sn-glycerol-3-phosphate acyltransferase [Chloroflexota bacterium]MCL5104055.1 1-acyl-sn-glycerol-3-phosphate acyltransferase [Armatimonadota bacterium]
MLYWVGATLSAMICRVFGRWRVIGRENVPKTGGALLCGNHVSYIDPPALGARSGRLVHFMAKLELFQIPVLGFLIRKVGAFPVKRGTADRAALKKAIELLQSGEVVGMFPEGKRSLDGELQPAEAGVGMIVLRAKVPVIPVALVNTEKLLPPHSFLLKFSRVTVVYGTPVPLEDLYDQSGREAVEEAGRRIMAAVGELLGKYRA